VAAGIKRVVYIEPYPKSLASDLYAEFISIDVSGTEENKVKFEPYVGVSPNRYLELFEMGQRKKIDGTRIDWNGYEANPRFFEPSDYYLPRELEKKKILSKYTKKYNEQS
jgi:hypothetical protein